MLNIKIMEKEFKGLFYKEEIESPPQLDISPLLEEANQGNIQVLQLTKDCKIYNQLLDILVEKCKNNNELLKKLARIIFNNDLETNENLVLLYRDLHLELYCNWIIILIKLAALSKSAKLYLNIIDYIIQYNLDCAKDASVREIRIYKMAQIYYWYLPSEIRASGDGFILKEKIFKIKG